jgi:hypothetical protein
VPAGEPRLERVEPVVKYTKTGDFNIAYWVLDDGPVDLLLLPGWTTHLELQWDVPPLRRFLERLAGFSRLILFDTNRRDSRHVDIEGSRRRLGDRLSRSGEFRDEGRPRRAAALRRGLRRATR